MKKIAHICVHVGNGGGGDYIRNLISHLGHQYEFHIFAPDVEKLISFVSEKNVFLHKINTKKLSIYNLYKFLKIIKTQKIDVIVSHGKGAGVYGRVAGLILRLPTNHYFHGFHYSKMKLVNKFLYLISEKLFSYTTNLYCFISESEAEKVLSILKIKKHKVCVNPNGVDITKFHTLESSVANSKVIYLARNDPIKNLDDFIKLAELSSLRRTSLTFDLVGLEPDELTTPPESLRGIIERSEELENIRILPYVADPQAVLASGRYYVSTSKGEGLPLAVLQAMSMGLNCILTNVSGHCDLIDNTKNGHLVEISEHYLNEMLEIIISLEKNDNRRAAISRAARSTVETKFTQAAHFDNVAKSYEEFF